VAIGDLSDFLGVLAPEQRRAWRSFDLCREALGYDPQRCAWKPAERPTHPGLCRGLVEGVKPPAR
jgi:hypothetical protein